MLRAEKKTDHDYCPDAASVNRKKLENLKAATALHIAHYNFCWRLREKGVSGKLRPTPAMEAGIVGNLWKIEDLYEHVMEVENERKSSAKYKRHAKKLNNL